MLDLVALGGGGADEPYDTTDDAEARAYGDLAVGQIPGLRGGVALPPAEPASPPRAPRERGPQLPSDGPIAQPAEDLDAYPTRSEVSM